ncbi:hypothetical protein D3C87_755140 [compost metagenome]
MSQRLEELFEKIRQERQRQFDLPGSEWDSQNSPGDWIALVNHYVSKEVRAKGVAPVGDDFEDSLIKAAAVIIAALSHTPDMLDRGQLI